MMPADAYDLIREQALKLTAQGYGKLLLAIKAAASCPTGDKEHGQRSYAPQADDARPETRRLRLELPRDLPVLLRWHDRG